MRVSCEGMGSAPPHSDVRYGFEELRAAAEHRPWTPRRLHGQVRRQEGQCITGDRRSELRARDP